MSRCLACSQENCDRLYPSCDCWCHAPLVERLGKKATIQFECRKHSRYAGLRKPRAACEDCWKVWFRKNPDRYL